MAGCVLTLDLAKRVGWCAGAPGGRPAYGTVVLGGPSHGAVYAALVDWLEDAIRLHRPVEIVAESPLVRGQHQGIDAGRLALGMFAHVELLAHDHSIRLLEEHVSRTRKAVIGRGNFAKGTAKQEVIGWCRAQGYTPPDDNAADALVLWRYVEALRMRRAA